MEQADTPDQLDHPGYIVLRDNTGIVFERLEGNKHWWTIGSLKAKTTEDIELPATILIKGMINE